MSVRTYKTNYEYLHGCSASEMADVLATLLIGMYSQCTGIEMNEEFIALNKIALEGWLNSPIVQGCH